MKIIYISTSRIPTDKAYGVNIAQMCEKIAECGVAVQLVLPKRINNIRQDIFSYHNVKPIFKVLYLPIFDAVYYNIFAGFIIVQIWYSMKLFFTRQIWSKEKAVALTRDHLPSLILKLRGYRVFHDLHGFPEKNHWFWKFFLRRMDGIIATNNWKKEQCIKQFHINADKIIVAPNGFSAREFISSISQAEARSKLNLPMDKKIVLYAGHLYDWKGAYILAKTAGLMPEILFIFVGGNSHEVNEFRRQFVKSDNIKIFGQKPHREIPLYLKSADVLALPNSQYSRDRRFAAYSRYDTSPIKLFEYMASNRPIVASSLPSIQEILNSNNSFLAQADNPDSFAKEIRIILGNKELAAKVAHAAFNNVQQYSWEKRAEKIVKFINNNL